MKIYTKQNGDIILATCGEVHLQKCLTDLVENFARIKVKTSEPIVTFKETIMYKKFKKIKRNFKRDW